MLSHGLNWLYIGDFVECPFDFFFLLTFMNFCLTPAVRLSPRCKMMMFTWFVTVDNKSVSFFLKAQYAEQVGVLNF